MHQDADYRSFLQNILENPDKIHVFDCSFEANPYWNNQEYSIHDNKPEKVKKAYWEDVDRIKDEIDRKDISIKIILGRSDLQNFPTGQKESNTYSSGSGIPHLPTPYGSGTLVNSFDEIICWPTRFLHDTILEQAPLLGVDHSVKMNHKLFVSHMHFPKQHRLALLEVLIDNNSINKGTVRFCNNLSSWQNFLKDQHNHLYTEIVEKILPYAPDLFSPYKYKPNSPGDKTFIIDPHYNTGFIDISPESHYNCNFITQKSCQPILWGKPFCMMGSTQQNTILKKLGFELFDEIFDYSHETNELGSITIHGLYSGDGYDFLKDHYHKLIKNLWNLDDSQESIEDMKQKFSAKIEHNLNRYMQIVFDDDMLPEYQETRDSFLVAGSRQTALDNPYLQKYVPIDKRKDRK